MTATEPAPPSGPLIAHDGTPLARHVWRPPGRPPRAVVVLVHGLGDHLGRYARLGERLAARGRLALGADLRGHGRSGGQRGHVERFEDYLADLDRVLAEARRETRGPVVLLGHSLGAVIALRHAETRPGGLAGLVLSGIGVELGVAIPWWKRAAAPLGALAFPRLPFDNGIDPADIASDRAVGAAYDADPLVHRAVTPRWFREFAGARVRALAEAGTVTCPTLLVHGADDRIALPAGSMRLARRIPSATLSLYPGVRHEVFNDPVAALVWDDLETWLGRVEQGAACPP